ncbi:AAA family ATPase [Cryobacterium sp. Sr8]|uniref:AAA family ATPase n=1 Tax=Cryobacterium sp. Sr8 TaxID=1259203 RepID=UPI0018E085C8|nr:AAA family ATPase [Cryobacterium sp. Sr8]
MYDVEFVDSSGQSHRLGGTKIGRFGLKPARNGPDIADDERLPRPPTKFKQQLGPDFFSLAQDSSFYEALTEIGDGIRDEILKGLQDIAFDEGLLARAEKEDVTRVSLLRSVPLLTVREQFHRLAHGGARLTAYNLRYTLKYTKTDPLPSVDFRVEPGSLPPTNLHVLIGRNGVGKSTFLNNLAVYLVQSAGSDDAKAQREAAAESGSAISNLVSVSFSAFDAFEPISVPQRAKGLTYHYVGLKKKRAKKDDPEGIKGPQALAREMTDSVRLCFEGARLSRWLRGLRLLEADPIFAAAGIADVAENAADASEVLEHIGPIFRRLSSGHKIVLLTITKLVETVEEKSLVLLDEPEAHLHPPLLSAFVRALSDLLVNRNGVAIVATHSPVVLQEVPKSCVWKIGRNGDDTWVARPKLETFGENVGTLIDEVFGLEVTSTGFHRLLADAALRSPDYDTALAQFGGQLGAEGKAILRAMVRNLNASLDVVG